mmetsp:Transcript_61861/g.177422  ORF Transcript_61861/g.177422 Transcript_61861/m.177422 type:complete len:220 (+) Transcript_61861:556-1215(+)
MTTPMEPCSCTEPVLLTKRGLMADVAPNLIASALSATTWTSVTARPSDNSPHMTSKPVARPRIASNTSSMICIGGSERGSLEVRTTRSQCSANAQPTLARSPRLSSPSQPNTAVSTGVSFIVKPNDNHSRTSIKALRTSEASRASWRMATTRSCAVTTSMTPEGACALVNNLCNSASSPDFCCKPSRSRIASNAAAAASAPRAAGAPTNGSRSSTGAWP